MIKKLVAWLILASFGTTVATPERSFALEVEQKSALKQAFKLYSESKTVGDFLTAVRSDISPTDYAHLSAQFEKHRSDKLPQAELSGDRLVLTSSGRSHTAKFIDLNLMSFSIDGKPVSYDVDLSMEENLARMVKAVGTSASFLDMVLPSAYADGGASLLIIAIIALLAVAGVRMIWKMANKTALDQCAEWKTRLKKNPKVSENDKTGLNVQLGYLSTKVLVNCMQDESNEKCRELKKSETCLKEALDMMEVQQQAYGGSGKVPPAVGGNTPAGQKRGTGSAEQAL